MIRTSQRLLGACLIAISIATIGEAAPSYFTASATLPSGLGTLTAERNLFRSAVASSGGHLSLNSFESFPESVNQINFGDFTAKVIGGDNFTRISNNNLITTDGNSVLIFGVPFSTIVELDFNTPINAIGIDITDIDIAPVTISFTDNLGDTLSDFAIHPTHSMFAGATFFGMVNEQSFTKVQFGFTASSKLFGLDQLEYGIVPEPSTAALLVIGCVVFSVARRPKSPSQICV